jgi:hypothetical protein
MITNTSSCSVCQHGPYAEAIYGGHQEAVKLVGPMKGLQVVVHVLDWLAKVGLV